MADRCFGCTGKFKFREKPAECPKCRRLFCSKCLDRKKVKEEGASCVYCSQKQKSVNRSEDSNILQNFHERYYKHKNQGPPIVSRLQFDPKLASITQAHANAINERKTISSEEDKELEERYMRLRSDNRTSTAPPSLTELENRFNKYQEKDMNNSSVSGSDGGIDTANKTEFEQTENLIQQMKEEIEIDNKVEGVVDNDLKENKELNFDTNQVSEDPETLLSDLHKFTEREEKEALDDVTSPDIQSLLHVVKPTNQIADSRGEAMSSKLKSGGVSQDELKILMRQAMVENKIEEKERIENEQFIKYASKKVKDLIDSDSEEEVKSKPKNEQKSGNDFELNFNWSHYGNNEYQLGLLSDQDFDKEVHSLIQQMCEEARLEQNLETSGIKLNDESTDGAVCVTSNEEKLPWCCICNGDAHIKCYDCNEDLYCVPCFSQGHEGFGLFDHRYIPYEPSSSYS